MTADHDDTDDSSDDGDDDQFDMVTGDHIDEPTAKGTMSTSKFSIQDQEMTEMAKLNEKRAEKAARDDDDS